MTSTTSIQEALKTHDTLAPQTQALPSHLVDQSHKVREVLEDRRLAFAALADLADLSGQSLETVARIGPVDPSWTQPASWTKDNFLRRIKPKERAQIIQTIQKVLAHPSKMPDAASILAIDPHSPMSYEERTACIMYHYLEGNIDKSQASRLFLYETCRQHAESRPETSIVPIHSLVGEQSEESFRLLQEGFPKFFSDEDWERLKTVIQENPQEPWDFFTVTYPLMTPEEVSQAIFDKRIDLFNLIRHQGNGQQLGTIPNPESNTMTALAIPPRLWAKMLEIRFGKQSMALDLVLGYREIERLSNTTSRVASVPCPLVTTPDYIHPDIFADRFTFYAHDLYYHIYIESANPHRELWTNIAKLFQRSNPELFETLIDRDHPMYIKHAMDVTKLIEAMVNHFGRDPTPEELFWLSLPFIRRLHTDKDRVLIMRLVLELAPHLTEPAPASLSELRHSLSQDFGIQKWIKALAEARGDAAPSISIHDPLLRSQSIRSQSNDPDVDGRNIPGNDFDDYN